MLDRDKLRIAGWLAAAVVAVLLGAHLLGGVAGGSGEPAGVTIDTGGGRGATPLGGETPARPAAADALVQVAGEVARPGVYRVRAGARVNDAVARAGGLTRKADPAGVNLVARLQDGQQVIVPRRGAAGATAAAGATGGGGAAGTGAGGAAAGAAAGPISLSSATVAQLDGLDGIGPTLAQRIVEFRQAHGGFRSVEQLRDVPGIGEKRFAALKKAVAP
jgi:competence protein ComEA